MKILRLIGIGSPLLATLCFAPQVAHTCFEDLCSSIEDCKFVTPSMV